MEYSNTFQVIWADIDANMHMRHTAYNDYAAQVRVNFLNDHGYSFKKLIENHIGPILFREETKFLREVGMSEKIRIDYSTSGIRKDGTRWTMVHQIFREDNVKAAVITVEGAWMNLKLRKLTVPPKELMDVIEHMPKTDDFQWIPDKTSR
jgi:acyl-CoA thioester hydrolase